MQSMIDNIKGPDFYLKQISAVLYGGNSEEIDLAALAEKLNQTRKELLNAQSIQLRLLPDLNP